MIRVCLPGQPLPPPERRWRGRGHHSSLPVTPRRAGLCGPLPAYALSAPVDSSRGYRATLSVRDFRDRGERRRDRLLFSAIYTDYNGVAAPAGVGSSLQRQSPKNRLNRQWCQYLDELSLGMVQTRTGDLNLDESSGEGSTHGLSHIIIWWHALQFFLLRQFPSPILGPAILVTR